MVNNISTYRILTKSLFFPCSTNFAIAPEINLTNF